MRQGDVESLASRELLALPWKSSETAGSNFLVRETREFKCCRDRRGRRLRVRALNAVRGKTKTSSIQGFPGRSVMDPGSTIHPIRACGKAFRKAARAGRVRITSPTAPSLKMRIPSVGSNWHGLTQASALFKGRS